MRRFLTLLAALLLAAALAVPAPAQKPSSDDVIYDQVRMKLANHPDVKGGAIEVEVKDGVVTLRGKVRTDKAKTKADGVAGKVKGVKKVINELTVAPT